MIAALVTIGILLMAADAPSDPAHGLMAADGPSAAAHDDDSTGAPPPFERADVRSVSERIVCYCGCPHLQVSKCFCGTADSMRLDIANRLDAGESEEDVIAAYVKEHGTWILAVPPREGFNWVIWVGPPVALVAGVLLLLGVGRRWSRPTHVLPVREAVALGEAEQHEKDRYRAELADALRRLDK